MKLKRLLQTACGIAVIALGAGIAYWAGKDGGGWGAGAIVVFIGATTATLGIKNRNLD